MLHADTELEQNNAPSFDFDEAAELCGLSSLQRDFAKAILRGANRTQAARAAGYSGTDEQLRGAGYKAYNSPKVQAFLSRRMSALPPIADIKPHRLECLLLAKSGHSQHLDPKTEVAVDQYQNASDWIPV